MNNHLREVQKKLQEAQKEALRLEQEARRLKIKDKLALFTEAIANDEEMAKYLEKATKEDVKIIAEAIVSNFNNLLEAASEELEEARLRREERNERRKARQEEKSDSSAEEEEYLGDKYATIKDGIVGGY